VGYKERAPGKRARQRIPLKLKAIYVLGKGKGNVDLYSASSRTPLTLSDMDLTVLPANTTISDY